MKTASARLAILQAMQKLASMGLNRGSAGNVSVRLRGNQPDSPVVSGSIAKANAQSLNTTSNFTFLVTPSGVPTDQLAHHMMVEVNAVGEYQGEFAPSSEWRFHRDIYAARPEIHAVVHTHAPFATTLACLHKDIPPFHYMIAVAGGTTIRCAPYAIFGSQELSNHAVQALEDRKACLLANHGMIAIGKDLNDAMRIAAEVESLCEQYWRALQIGNPVLLSDSEMSAVLDKFKTYGPNAAGK